MRGSLPKGRAYAHTSRCLGRRPDSEATDERRGTVDLSCRSASQRRRSGDPRGTRL